MRRCRPTEGRPPNLQGPRPQEGPCSHPLPRQLVDRRDLAAGDATAHAPDRHPNGPRPGTGLGGAWRGGWPKAARAAWRNRAGHPARRSQAGALRNTKKHL